MSKTKLQDLIPDYRGDDDPDYPPYPAPSKLFLSYCRIYGLKKEYSEICEAYNIDRHYPPINQDIKEYLGFLEDTLSYHKSMVRSIKEEVIELEKRIGKVQI